MARHTGPGVTRKTRRNQAAAIHHVEGASRTSAQGRKQGVQLTVARTSDSQTLATTFCGWGSTATLANKAAHPGVVLHACSMFMRVCTQDALFACMRLLPGARVARAVSRLTPHASSQGTAPIALWPRADASNPGQDALPLDARRPCSYPHSRRCGARAAAPATASEPRLARSPRTRPRGAPPRGQLPRLLPRSAQRAVRGGGRLDEVAEAHAAHDVHGALRVHVAPQHLLLRARPLCSDAAAAPGARLVRAPRRVRPSNKSPSQNHIHLARYRPSPDGQILQASFSGLCPGIGFSNPMLKGRGAAGGHAPPGGRPGRHGGRSSWCRAGRCRRRTRTCGSRSWPAWPCRRRSWPPWPRACAARSRTASRTRTAAGTAGSSARPGAGRAHQRGAPGRAAARPGWQAGWQWHGGQHFALLYALQQSPYRSLATPDASPCSERILEQCTPAVRMLHRAVEQPRARPGGPTPRPDMQPALGAPRAAAAHRVAGGPPLGRGAPAADAGQAERVVARVQQPELAHARAQHALQADRALHVRAAAGPRAPPPSG